MLRFNAIPARTVNSPVYIIATSSLLLSAAVRKKRSIQQSVFRIIDDLHSIGKYEKATHGSNDGGRDAVVGAKFGKVSVYTLKATINHRRSSRFFPSFGNPTKI